MRVKARMGEDYRSLKRTIRELSLVTVCEEAGCPNIYECWADGTATFMINGERCTRRAVSVWSIPQTTSPDPAEPDRVAEAISRMALAHAVITTVARDDLADGGASGFCRHRGGRPASVAGDQARVADIGLQGRSSLACQIFDSRPDVLITTSRQ